MDGKNAYEKILQVRSDHQICPELRQIDNGCAECIYEAGRLARREVLEAVITNELTEEEQLVVRLHWIEDLSLQQIARNFGLSREYVRRCAEKAKRKIYASMKYIVLYDEMLDGRKPLPESFKFTIVKNFDGKELVS